MTSPRQCKRCKVGTMYPVDEHEWVELRCYACGEREEVETEKLSRLRPKGETGPGRPTLEARQEKQCQCGRFISLKSTSCNSCAGRTRRRPPDRRCLKPGCGHEWRLRARSQRDKVRCPHCMGYGAEEISVSDASGCRRGVEE